MVHEKNARSFMNTLRPAWLSCADISVGKSRGLLVTWDPNKLDIVPYLSCGGIFLTSICIESKRELMFLNVYGLCSDIGGFGNKVAESGMLSHKNSIIVGDLNFTEMWVRSRETQLKLVHWLIILKTYYKNTD
jgi:hypothetical protein